MNANQIRRYRQDAAAVLNNIQFTHCCTICLRTSHQTIERAEAVARNFLWNLNKEAFTRKGLRNGRRLSFAAVMQGREGLNLHLHCAMGNFNKNHNDDLIWMHCQRAAGKTEGFWDRPLTSVQAKMGIELTFDRKPLWDKAGWVRYILRENSADPTYDKPFFDTRDADRILVNLISEGK